MRVVGRGAGANPLIVGISSAALCALIGVALWVHAEAMELVVGASTLPFGSRPLANPGLVGETSTQDIIHNERPHGALLHGNTSDVANLQTVAGFGQTLSVGGVPVYGPAGEGQYLPAVGFDGANLLVVWEDRRCGYDWDIYCARVSVTGAVLDTVGILVSGAVRAQRHPSVVFDGIDFLVVWEDSRNGFGRSDIYGARVTADGTVLDGEGIAISVAANDRHSPEVAFDGANCLVVWEDYRSGTTGSDIYGARVSAGGAVLDADGISISTSMRDQQHPAVVFDGSDFLVVWDDYRSGSNYDVYGARMTSDGIVLDGNGIAISTSMRNQQYPAVTSDGTNSFVVWHDYRIDVDADIYGARVSTTGLVLDAAGRAISTGAGAQQYPAVAFDGADYLAVWQDNREYGDWDICGARVAITGTVIDPSGIIVSTSANDESSPAVVFAGGDYLAVWEDSRNGDDLDIYGARVDTAGETIDEGGIPISNAANGEHAPAVAFSGTNYLVVWQDRRNGSDYDIYGMRVTPEGENEDGTGISVSSAAEGQQSPAVAFDGTNYLVVWQDNRDYGHWDIYGARVSPEGEVLDADGIAISAALDGQYSPAIAFDGTNYLVVWEDSRNGGTYAYDIYGARVTTSGVVLDGTGIAIATEVNYQQHPAVAFDGTNYLVVWDDFRAGASDIYGARVSRTGSVLDIGGRAISSGGGGKQYPAIAFDGSDYLVVWDDTRNGSFDIYGSRVSTGGAVLDASGVAVSVAAREQQYPALAFDGTDFLAVWQDRRNGTSYDIGNYQVYGARLNISGDLLDPDGFPVSASGVNQLSPAVTHGPRCTLFAVYESFTAPPYSSYRIWGSMWKGPTGIIFASFSAAGYGGYVTLCWRMAVDVPISNFAIERAQSADGPYTKLELPISREAGLLFSSTDHSVQPGNTYWYKIVLVSFSGEESYGPIEVRVDTVPTAYMAYQSYPNPFNPRCAIRYDIPSAGRVGLRVFDVSGSLVRTLVNGRREPGVYSELWDGKTDDGRELPSGVYFYRLEVAGFVATRKMVLLR